MTGRLIPNKDLMLEPGLIHLQTGGVGAMPRPVFDATMAAMAEIETDPVRATYGPAAIKLDKVRAQAARLVGAGSEEIVLTTSATAGMFLIAQGLPFTHGDRIVITDHEHPGGRFGWEWAARRYGLHVDTVRIDPGERDPRAIIDRIAEVIGPRTRVISFSHILFTTGLKLPAAELCALGREHGCWTVIDGAQSPGAMPVDVKAIGCHAYAVSGHKWLLGPKGSGFLYISDEMADALDALPLAAGRQPNSDSTGIVNMAGARGLGAAIDYLDKIGPQVIAAHNQTLRAELYDLLSKMHQVTIPALADGPLASANLAFCLPDSVNLHAIRRKLVQRHNVYIRVVELSGFAGLRASLHLYNSSDDVRALVDALGAELAA
jgi:selenocysteine lyase/cysteine desulfurase